MVALARRKDQHTQAGQAADEAGGVWMSLILLSCDLAEDPMPCLPYALAPSCRVRCATTCLCQAMHAQWHLSRPDHSPPTTVSPGPSSSRSSRHKAPPPLPLPPLPPLPPLRGELLRACRP